LGLRYFVAYSVPLTIVVPHLLVVTSQSSPSSGSVD
jgi:hypothetical protein